MIEMNHTKKYMVIDGHLVTLSFSKTPNTDLYSRIKSILLSSETYPYNCLKEKKRYKIQQTKEGV